LESYNGEGTAAVTRIRWEKKNREVDELDERSITDIWVEDLIAIEAALYERNLEKGSAEEPEFSEAKGSL
jgi:hypothetical protein